jgi:hypothetical protein
MVFEILIGVALALILLPIFSIMLTWLTNRIYIALQKRFGKGRALGLNLIISRFLAVLLIVFSLAFIFFLS